ncbi:Beta-barrel assembly machine subunit BamA [Desulfosoma caldarium]|uniref:Outer membrane protein assembly factor BamA n=2 Tax=Desulfosoma caldarium TaxID=610254 RepID=A0A3N1UQ83_9BACT|nr:Beta-barrel assembly machine subunit BamA [Desulfosoma caldarium]
MARKLGYALGVLLLWALSAQGQEMAPAEHPRVAVAPFAVHTAQPQPQLSTGVQELIAQSLLNLGVELVPLPEVRRAAGNQPVASESQALDLARRLKARYVIWGSLTQLGDKASVDGRLVDAERPAAPQVLFVEGDWANLVDAAQQMAQQVTVHVLAKAVVADVSVRGTERIEPDAILVQVKTKKGELLSQETLQEDLRTIYKMGFFETVAVDVTDTDKGKQVTFVVREKPSVVDVKIKGNDKIKDKDILAAISTKPFTVLRMNVVNDDANRIVKLYHQKAFFHAEVSPSVEFPQDPRKAVVTFRIKEGKKVYVKRVTFTGNKHFSDRKLRGIMETKARGFFSWVSDKGVLDREVLDTDLDRLTAFYHDRGFMDARAGTPSVEMKDDGFHVTIPVMEGERYRVSSVQVQGDLLETTPKVAEKLELKEKQYFSREKLRKDLDTLTKHLMDAGHAYAEVDPMVTKNQESHTATVVYQLRKGPVVHIEKITITGNTRTRDNVIRREIQLAEGDRFSVSALERSQLNLRRVDYFEEVDIQSSQSSSSEAMNLNVKVKEKPTGALSVGGGYSSEDGVFVGGNIMERNLFGRGQYLALKAYLGGQTSRYSISFTEPWLFDIPLSAGFDLYDWYREYNDFDKDATGGKLRISHPFGTWSRWHLAYVFESAKVSNVAEDAALIIKDQEGRQIKSSLIGSIERDSTDHPFLPTRGSTVKVSLEYSIPYLGSDSDFVSVVCGVGRYVPLWWKFVGFAHVKGGYIFELDADKPAPIYERFFLGGINSIRAFRWGDVGPKDPETGDSIGGIKFGQVNLELLFPLVEKIGMRGVLFFDAGNAFAKGEDFRLNDFRKAGGMGLRWNSPLGPLRIEWGYNLDRKSGEDTSNWQFSMGVFF